jgi:hypothetical protein
MIRDLTGKKFGKLLVLDNVKGGKKLCKCDCGNIVEVNTSKLISGHTTSCGCLRKERQQTINGLYKTRLHRIWVSMHARCECPSHRSYEKYKDRKICDEWHLIPKARKQLGFLAFFNWAMANGYSDNLTLDRIDNDKGYSPDNCRWITNKEQQKNKSDNVVVEYMGVKKILTDWVKELNISRMAVVHCVRRYGLTYQEAFDRYTKMVYNPSKFCWEEK